jgi:alkylation response protein AidB-like acyl-CoA dehydrogenase
MDVRLSPEQVALRDAAVQVVTRLGLTAVRDLDDTERASKLDAAVAASGWRELRAPSDEGGPWASAVEVAVVAEELGRGLADAPYVGPTMAAELRRLAGAPPASEPETVLLCPALTSPARVRAGALEPGAVALDGRGAVRALVPLPGQDGYGLGSVTLGVPAARSEADGGHGEGADLTRSLVGAGPDAVIAAEGETGVLGSDDMTRWRALGLAVTAADLVGVMRGALDIACAYARTRRQYGVAIGSFQAVQHMLADARVAMEGSRSIALHAAWAVDALQAGEACAAAAAAKAYCTRAARAVCETGIQVHGGIGNTWDCLAHVFLRRALLSGEAFGGVGVNLERVLEARGIGGVDGLR